MHKNRVENDENASISGPPSIVHSFHNYASIGDIATTFSLTTIKFCF